MSSKKQTSTNEHFGLPDMFSVHSSLDYDVFINSVCFSCPQILSSFDFLAAYKFCSYNIDQIIAVDQKEKVYHRRNVSGDDAADADNQNRIRL